MLTAFCVDNGHQLPLLSHLPTWTYWTLPGLVGVPIVAWTIMRHPVITRTRNSARDNVIG